MTDRGLETSSGKMRLGLCVTVRKLKRVVVRRIGHWEIEVVIAIDCIPL